MDPRHPELAISRIDELMERYKAVLAKMGECTLSAQLGGLEREGGLVVQEICLVAPRLHEAMVQVSRQRRHDIARGILVEPQDTAVELPEEEPEEPEIDETLVEEAVADEPAELEDAPALEPVVELPAEPVELVEKSEPTEEKETISETETTTDTEETSATNSKTEQVEPVKEEKKPKKTTTKTTTKKTTKKADK